MVIAVFFLLFFTTNASDIPFLSGEELIKFIDERDLVTFAPVSPYAITTLVTAQPAFEKAPSPLAASSESAPSQESPEPRRGKRIRHPTKRYGSPLLSLVKRKSSENSYSESENETITSSQDGSPVEATGSPSYRPMRRYRENQGGHKIQVNFSAQAQVLQAAKKEYCRTIKAQGGKLAADATAMDIILHAQKEKFTCPVENCKSTGKFAALSLLRKHFKKRHCETQWSVSYNCATCQKVCDTFHAREHSDELAQNKLTSPKFTCKVEISTCKN